MNDKKVQACHLALGPLGELCILELGKPPLS